MCMAWDAGKQSGAGTDVEEEQTGAAGKPLDLVRKPARSFLVGLGGFLALAGLIVSFAALPPTPKPALAQGGQAMFYEGAVSGEGFILDLSGREPRLRFEQSPEILVPQAEPIPRNQVRYTVAFGGPVIRVSGTGGATLFFEQGSKGEPYGPTVPAEQLTPRAWTRAEAEALAQQVRETLSNRLGLPLTLTVGWDSVEPSGTSPRVVAEAVQNLEIALTRMAADPLAYGALTTSLTSAVVTRGDEASLALEKGALVLTFQPAEGYSGRPSSYEIEAFLEDSL